MKKAAVDAPATAEECKDKRTLVLFLLALLIVAVDLVPVAQQKASPLYGVRLETIGGGWQVIRLPAGGPESGTEKTPISLLDPQGPAANTLPAPLALFLNQPLPINRADRAALEMLPGVGPHLAAAIEQTRQRRGPLTGPEDLLEVPGIGPQSLQRLLPLVSFE